MATPEGLIEIYARRVFRDAGFKFLKVKGPIGWPDRQIVGPDLRGRTFYMELKQPSGKLSPAQVATIAELRSFGYDVFVCFNEQQVDIALRYIQRLSR